MKEIVVDAAVPMIETELKSQMETFTESVKTQIEAAMKELTPRFSMEETTKEDPKGGFKSLAHFAHDVYQRDVSQGRNVSKELSDWEVKAAGTGMQAGDLNYGGSLIPVEFRNQLLVMVEESNELLPRCTSLPMGAQIIEIPYLYSFDQSGGLVHGGIVWKWVDEDVQLSEVRPKTGKFQLKLHPLTGLAYVSDQLMKFSPQSVEALIQRGFTDGLNYQYNYVLVRGTGAGQPMGVLNSPCLVTAAAETGQQAATILYENIIKMYQSAWNPARCVWVANPNTLIQLATMGLAVGTGGAPVFLPAGGASGSPYNTLMGLPVFWNDHCSTLGTVGDIMLVDFSQYFVGRPSGNEGVQFDTSIHIKFDYAQNAFRFLLYFDGKFSWPTYFTPPQATTSYRSPAVVLATRS